MKPETSVLLDATATIHGRHVRQHGAERRNGYSLRRANKAGPPSVAKASGLRQAFGPAFDLPA
mgnify:CR=1 FL=1